MDRQNNRNTRLETALKWGVGGLIAWHLLKPRAKNELRHSSVQ